jgi:hypothetical protein
MRRKGNATSGASDQRIPLGKVSPYGCLEQSGVPADSPLALRPCQCFDIGRAGPQFRQILRFAQYHHYAAKSRRGGEAGQYGLHVPGAFAAKSVNATWAAGTAKFSAQRPACGHSERSEASDALLLGEILRYAQDDLCYAQDDHSPGNSY